MKSLHLLRHAKSSWKDPGLNDHDRPLNRRGRQMAKMMAAYLRRVKIAPDLGACGRCYVLPTRSQRRNCSVERDLSIPDKTSSAP